MFLLIKCWGWDILKRFCLVFHIMYFSCISHLVLWHECILLCHKGTLDQVLLAGQKPPFLWTFFNWGIRQSFLIFQSFFFNWGIAESFFFNCKIFFGKLENTSTFQRPSICSSILEIRWNLCDSIGVGNNRYDDTHALWIQQKLSIIKMRMLSWVILTYLWMTHWGKAVKKILR